LAEGRPHALDMLKNGEIDLIINTPSGKVPRKDEIQIRSLAVAQRIPILTTTSGVEASIRAIKAIQAKGISVTPLQRYHAATRPWQITDDK
jgi:carbamoyl-phosphate synthase large subunit